MQQHHIIGLMAMGCLNGIFSPAMPYLLIFNGLWYPAFLPASLAILHTLTSLLVATLTIMVSGIPAAIYERMTGATSTTEASAFVWIGAMALLTLPSMIVLVRGGFL